MFNRQDESSDEESVISEEKEPEFGIVEPELKIDQWKPKPYPDNRRGLHVKYK